MIIGLLCLTPAFVPAATVTIGAAKDAMIFGTGANTDTAGGGELSKFLVSGLTWPRELRTGMDPKLWVMSDIWVRAQPTVHTGYRKGLNYLMLDGSVDFVADSPRKAFH